MIIINNLQIEITQIIVRTNNLLNKRIIDNFKRRLWIENISDTSEYSYRVEANYVKCGCLIMGDGERILTKESYEELAECLNEIYVNNIEKNGVVKES